MGRMGDLHAAQAADRAESAGHDAAYWEDRARRLEAERDGLLRALGGFLWLGNNLHNIRGDPEPFRHFYEACLGDAKDAIARIEKEADR